MADAGAEAARAAECGAPQLRQAGRSSSRRARNDVAGAEDALPEAMAAALADFAGERRPAHARRLAADGRRGGGWLTASAGAGSTPTQRRSRCAASPRWRPDPLDEPVEPEERGLLFACAHPAIEPAARAPLMLQASARLRRRDDRVGLPRRAGDDGASASCARRRRSGQAGIGTEAPGAPTALPERVDAAPREAVWRGVCRGLVRPRRHLCAPAQPRRRRDLARPPRRRAAARRRRSARPAGADAARARAPRGAPRRRRPLRAARRAGRRALGRADDRRGRGAARARDPPARHRPLPARGSGAIGARGAAARPACRLGRDRPALRRAVRAHRFAGGGAESRGRDRRDRRPGGGAGRARRACRRRAPRRLPAVGPRARR